MFRCVAHVRDTLPANMALGPWRGDPFKSGGSLTFEQNRVRPKRLCGKVIMEHFSEPTIWCSLSLDLNAQDQEHQMKQDKDQTPKRNDFGLQRNLFIWPPSLYNLVVHGTLWNVRAVVDKVRTNNKFACFQMPVKQNRRSSHGFQMLGLTGSPKSCQAYPRWVCGTNSSNLGYQSFCILEVYHVMKKKSQRDRTHELSHPLTLKKCLRTQLVWSTPDSLDPMFCLAST